MAFEVEVRSTANAAIGGGTFLDEAYGRSCLAQKNKTGSWSLSLLRDSSQVALCTPYRWLRFKLDGDVLFAGRIEPWDQDTLVDGEEADEGITFSGNGTAYTLRDGIVARGPQEGRLVSETRYFNFATPEYLDTPDLFFWTSAFELFQQGDNVLSLYGSDTPEDWPDPSAYWIWSQDIDLGDDPPMPVGDAYFVTEQFLVEGDYKMFIAADDGYELYVDGVKINGITEAFHFRQFDTFDVHFDADGYHVVGIKGTNIERTSSATNGAAVLFAMYSTVDGGELDTLALHTDSTWWALGYPTTPPGFTGGEIMRILVEEVQDRGGLVLWDLGFLDAYTSDGVFWTDRIEIGFTVGEKLDGVLAKLAETWVDYDVRHDTITLDMWNKGGRPNGSSVTLAVGSDLTGLKHGSNPAVVTEGYVHRADGNFDWVSSGSSTDFSTSAPRIEAMIEAGSALSKPGADKIVEGTFSDLSDQSVLANFTWDRSAGKQPFVDVWPGKTITVPDRYLSNASSVVEEVNIADVGDEDGDTTGDVIVTASARQ